jgi:hypothetical protein
MVADGHPPPVYQESKKLPGAKVRDNVFHGILGKKKKAAGAIHPGPPSRL